MEITRTTEVHHNGELVSREVETLPAHEGNTHVLRDRAIGALDTNAAFLALDPPTQAQVLAQVRALTRQSSALIRLSLGYLDSIDGT
jgi:hypothetical protein